MRIGGGARVGWLLILSLSGCARSESTATVTTVPTAACTVLADGGGKHPSGTELTPPEPQLSIPAPAPGQTDRLAAYWKDGSYLLAPRGWRCTGELGGDGSALWSIASATDGSALVQWMWTMTWGEILTAVCPVVPEAADDRYREFGAACEPQVGVAMRRTGSGSVALRIDPDVRAGGFHFKPSSYQQWAMADFDLASDRHLEATSCALPLSERDLCTPILAP